MWSDNETEIDLLDFTHLVAAVISIISDKNLHPATIGIYGDWGSGKSSLMRMVRATLEKRNDKKILTIQFNGWLFESYEDAKSALMGTILDEIANHRNILPKAQALISKLLRQIDLMRLMVGAGKYLAAYAVAGNTGLALTAATDIPTIAKSIATKVKDIDPDEIEKIIRENQTEPGDLRLAIREFHNDFTQLLKETEIETLVVFIDDLDRCNPATVLDIFEAIRLFLFVPNSVYVIAADENLVRYAVSTKFPGYPEKSENIGRDYLEKLVQYPIKVPTLGKSEIENYIKLLFVESVGIDKGIFEKVRTSAFDRTSSSFQGLCLDYDRVHAYLPDVPINLIDGFSLAETLAPILAVSLSGNPRQTKRFLNMLQMRIAMAQARNVDLKIRVLAKLMLLEYFQPDAFKQLAELQASQEGLPKVLEILEKDRELAGFKYSTSPHSEGAKPVTERKPVTDKANAAIKNDRATKEGVSPESPDLEKDLGEDEITLVKTWKSDKWIRDWLSLEPALSGCDLRAYFFFSRDNLAFDVGTARRLNPTAQKLLANLLGDSEVVRRKALSDATGLNMTEANSVFSSLADYFRRQDKPDTREGILNLMFDLVDKRKELITQIIIFLKNVPENNVPLVTVPRLLTLTHGREEINAVYALFQGWSTNKLNSHLAEAARQRLLSRPATK
jgi:predicted KAP-like P-loop ATPase